MACKPIVTLALLMGCAAFTQGEAECSDAGECGAEENSLLAVHSAQNSPRLRNSSVQCKNSDGTRFECAAGDKCCGNACYAPGSKCCKPEGPKNAWYPVSKDTECRKASVQCTNRNGDEFECASGDQCCGDTCVSKDDVCCENVLGNNFPCQGNGGGCCGNTCSAPGSKCCKPDGPKSAWYPVSKDTQCRQASVECKNSDGTRFECAAGDKCCGGACVGEHDVCCENVNGDSFPCQGEGGGCCGNACYAPGSKCCKPEGPKNAWYPVSKDTECRKASVQCTNRNGDEFECASGDQCCGDTCVSKDDVCCESVLGNNFPCQGNGGGCCGNTCSAPGSKCCKPDGPKSAWYPVSKDTQCRQASVECKNSDGTRFECAAGDKCCGGACVGEHDICCENVNGDSFPCQGEGGGCCGNACYAPGSKCCKPQGPKSAWYPVSKDTECRKASVQCTNRSGDEFECASGESCCGNICVSKDDVCCENVLGNNFPCQGQSGGCCGNACYAPGSKCCKSPWVAKAKWYPVTQATQCAW